MNQSFFRRPKNIACIASALLCALYGVFISPYVFNTATTESKSVLLIALCSVILVFSVICLLALYIQKSGANRAYGKAIVRVLLIGITYTVVGLLLSLLIGLIAQLMYFTLRNTLTLDQIKGIIDWIAMGITMLLLPIFISAFWSAALVEKPYFKSIASGVAVKGKNYLKLLIIVVLICGGGFLLTTAFRYAANNIFINIVKTVVFAFLGAFGILITERICNNTRGI